MTRRNTRTRRAAAPKWTAEEEEIILEEIGKSPTNIKLALFAAAEQLPIRSYAACNSHWYTRMANRDDVVGRITVGRYSTVRNKTRLKPEQEETHRKGHTKNIWNFIIATLFGNRFNGQTDLGNS